MLDIGNGSENCQKWHGRNGNTIDLALMERAVSASILASFLRDFPTGFMDPEEKDEFLRLQRFSVELEARCFEEAGFYRGYHDKQRTHSGFMHL